MGPEMSEEWGVRDPRGCFKDQWGLSEHTAQYTAKACKFVVLRRYNTEPEEVPLWT